MFITYSTVKLINYKFKKKIIYECKTIICTQTIEKKIQEGQVNLTKRVTRIEYKQHDCLGFFNWTYYTLSCLKLLWPTTNYNMHKV